MTKNSTALRPYCAADASAANDGTVWREEWVPLGQVVRLSKLQVRTKMDAGAVKRYRDQTAAGSVPPPIKVGRTPAGTLFLVDGWHRMEAGALDTCPDHYGDGCVQVRALVADLTDDEVRWESATANMGHGVPLRAGDYRNVFRAFIKARKHRKGRGQGQMMTYREVAAAIGKPHTTIRNWMEQDFPSTYRAMGGHDHGNHRAGPAQHEVRTLGDEHCEQAVQAAQSALAGLASMSAEQRHRVAEQMRAVVAEAERLGILAPIDAEAF